MKAIIKILSALTFFLISTIPANSQAELLFESGPPDSPTGLRISDIGPTVAADDFITTNAWEVATVEFWTDEIPDYFDWDGTVNYYIFLDDGYGKPLGSPIYQGEGQNITKVEDPSVNTIYSGFRYTIDVTEPLQLEENTVYWLGLNLGGGGTVNTTQAFWSATTIHLLSDAVLSFDLINWNIHALDLAFRLYSDSVQSEAVPVDVLPDDCPNVLPLKRAGKISIAILGTAEFDVTKVDVNSIRFKGVPPLKSKINDVATPYEPYIGKVDPNDCLAAGPDGFVDLTMKFGAREVIASLGPDVEDGDIVVLKVTGNLLEEFGGTPILGEDVVILKKSKR